MHNPHAMKARTVARRLAFECLQPPKQCSSIKVLTRDQLKNLIEMTQSGALSKRLACGDLQEVGEALQSQRTQILAHPNGRVAIVGPIVNALPGKMLKALMHGIRIRPLLRQPSPRLLTSFRSLLTEPEQRALVTQLPKSHPLRKSTAAQTEVV